MCQLLSGNQYIFLIQIYLNEYSIQQVSHDLLHEQELYKQYNVFVERQLITQIWDSFP